MGQWGNAIKAVIGAGLNALLGGINIGKKLEYLQGGASGVVAREILLKLRPYGFNAWNTVKDLGKMRFKFMPTWTNRLVNQGAQYIGNGLGYLLNSMIPPKESEAAA